ncbi:hypothetical protein F5Y17DRAFT_140058 [Xylariaceae sp. FL0594]|nr:hypothetical protein F5Y17DRAFT_140058 [Xylariaceae sp. FL0594]
MPTTTLEQDLTFTSRYAHDSPSSPEVLDELKARLRADPDAPTRGLVAHGKYRHTDSGFCCVPGYKTRETPGAIRRAVFGLGPEGEKEKEKSYWWWQAQFRLYGVPFRLKPGEDCREAAARALEEGRFDEPPPKLREIEERLAIEFERARHHHAAQLEDFYLKKRQVRLIRANKRKSSMELSSPAKRIEVDADVTFVD